MTATDIETMLNEHHPWSTNEIAYAIDTLKNIRAAAADDFDGEQDHLDLTVAIDVLEAVYRAIHRRAEK